MGNRAAKVGANKLPNGTCGYGEDLVRRGQRGAGVSGFYLMTRFWTFLGLFFLCYIISIIDAKLRGAW